jgi:hypothetical protein
MSNQETINFTANFTLSDPDGREGTIPQTQELANVIAETLSNTFWADVLYVSVSLGDQEN